jgi:hypothetical protein
MAKKPHWIYSIPIYCKIVGEDKLYTKEEFIIERRRRRDAKVSGTISEVEQEATAV